MQNKIKQMLDDERKRLSKYVKTGGTDSNYLEGKIEALEAAYVAVQPPAVLKKPLTQKQVTSNVKANDGRLKVVIAVDLDEIMDCDGVEGLNDLADGKILVHGTLSDISYRVVGFVEGKEGSSFVDGTVLLEVNSDTQGFDAEED